MTERLSPGLRAELLVMVEKSDTAIRLGSGDVPVLGTPRLIALAEAATVRAVRDALDDGQTTVGTRVDVAHRAPSPVGAHVHIAAELTEVDGRKLVFAVTATDKTGAVVGSGTIERAVVDREKFLSRL